MKIARQLAVNFFISVLVAAAFFMLSSSRANAANPPVAINSHGCVAGGNCYYVDYASGNDNNNGTSESTPWKHAWFMTGATGNAAAHTPSQTDEIILKGGTHWPFATFPWTVNAGAMGTPNNYAYPGMYIGYDPAWNDGTVNSVRITGSGYNCTSLNVVFTNAPGDTTGSGAAATAVIGTDVNPDLGLLVFVNITNGGANYTKDPIVSFTGNCTVFPTAVADITSPVADGSGGTFGNSATVQPPFMIELTAKGIVFDGIEVAHYQWPDDYTGSGGVTMVGAFASDEIIQNSYFHDFEKAGMADSNLINGADDSQTNLLAMGDSPGSLVTNSFFNNAESESHGCNPAIGYAGTCAQAVLVTGIETATNNYLNSARAGMYDDADNNSHLIAGNKMFAIMNDANSQHPDAFYLHGGGLVYNNIMHDIYTGSSGFYLENNDGSSPVATGYVTYMFNNVCWNVGWGGCSGGGSSEFTNSGATSISPLVDMRGYNNTAMGTQNVNSQATSQGSCGGMGQWYPSSPTLDAGAYPFSYVAENNVCISNGQQSGGQYYLSNGGSSSCPASGCGTFNGLRQPNNATAQTLLNNDNVIMTLGAAASQGYEFANMFSPTSASGQTVTFAGGGYSTNLTSLCSGTVGGLSLAPLCEDINGNPRPTTGGWQAGAYQFASSGGGGDTTPPSVPTGLTVSGTTTSTASLSWTASTDNVGVTGYKIYRGGTQIGTTGSVSYTDSGLTPSTVYSYTVSAYDAAGNNSAQSSAVQATTKAPSNDTTPPTVSITSPSNGATVSSTITISANASDNVAVASVQFLVDGSAIGTDTASPYTWSWNTATVSNGSHTVTAKATDTSGNTTSASVTVTVSNSSSGGGTLAFVNDASTEFYNNGGGGVSVTLNVTAGNLLVVGCGGSTDLSLDSVTDTAGNTFVLAASTYNSGYHNSAGVFYASNAKGSSSDTVTCNANSSADTGITVMQFSGATSAPLDATAVGQGSGTSVTSNAFSTATSSEVVVACSAVHFSVPNTFSMAGGYSIPAGASNGENACGYQILNSRQTNATAAMTLGASEPIPVIALATFKGGSATGSDTTPPTTSVTSPTSGATVSGTTTVSATASDNVGVTSVQFYLDNVLQSTDTTSPYTWSWNTASSTNGTHTLATKAYDAAGNVGSSASVSVTISNTILDTTPPTVAITSPANNASVQGTVAISGTASDNVSVSSVALSIDGGAYVAATGTTSWTFSWNSTLVANGTHTITARATDSSGNTTNQGISVIVSNPDVTPPSVPTGLQVTGTTTSTASISWTASTDNIGVTGYKIYRNGTQVGTTAATSFTDTGLNQSTTYSYTVSAYDAAGNNSAQSASAQGTTKFQDTTPPTVSVTSPANNATVSSTITLSATASDNVGVASVQFKIDGTLVGSPDTTSPYTFVWDSSQVANGSHSVTALAKDAAGNQTTSGSVSVTVNNPPPADTTPPSSPTNLQASNITTSSVFLSWTASTDNVGVTGYKVFRNGVQAGTTPTNTFTDAGLVASTTYSYTVSAYDAAGNNSALSGSVNATTQSLPQAGDTTPPSVAIVSPTNNQVVAGTLTIQGSASDNVSLASVQISIDAGSYVSVTNLTSWTYSLDTTQLSNGNHTITAKATDASGNTNTTAITIMVSNTAVSGGGGSSGGGSSGGGSSGGGSTGGGSSGSTGGTGSSGSGSSGSSGSGSSGGTTTLPTTQSGLEALLQTLLAELESLIGQLNTQLVSSFTRTLTIGSYGTDVKNLQVFLNDNGDTVSASGAGSPGNEAEYFGAKTAAALAKWQAANGISPASGILGPKTEAYMKGKW